ncbi:MAG: DUF2339 domain-containing protein [Hyphomicrobiales bacterium]
MESLFILGLLIVLAGPVLGIIALVQVSNQGMRLAALKRDMDRLLAQQGAATAPAPVPEPPAAVPEPPPAIAAEAAPPASKGWISSEPDTPAAPPSPIPAKPGKDVENALASRWLVWVGGVAVALGGLLFVKYAHDNGLIPPVLRVIIGLAFAAALVASGEGALRRGGNLAAGYIPAALSAAGLCIAFGVFYASYALYELINPTTAFVFLAATGLGAIWLSRRQGPLIAALGLVGSYAVPALVQTEQPSAFGFFAYLAVIVAASLYELRSRPWWWLGFAAIAGAGGWAVLWLHGSFFAPPQSFTVGVFALLLGAGAAFVPRGRGILADDMGTLADPKTLQPAMQVAVAGMTIAALVLALLVHAAGHATPALVFFLIGMAAISAFGWLRQGLVLASLLAAALALVVLMLWPGVAFHEWAFDERGFWTSVPGLVEPPRFRNWTLLAGAGFTTLGLAGAWLKAERRPWAALAAGSSVLFLFGAWARVDFTWSTLSWVIAACAFAVGLKAVAWRQRMAEALAEVQALQLLMVGVLLLGLFVIDRLFDGVWQTIAIATMAAAYAWATRFFPSAGLGAGAAGLGSLAAVRLFVGREFWASPTDLPLGQHWVLYGYGVPAVLLFLASRWLAAGRWRMALEGLALGLGISLVSLEIRVLIGGSSLDSDIGFLESSAHAMAWLGAAYGLACRQQVFSGFISRWGAIALLAASCLVMFVNLTFNNPVLTGDGVAGGAFFNALWLAYLVPVPVLALMARKLEGLGPGAFARWTWHLCACPSCHVRDDGSEAPVPGADS